MTEEEHDPVPEVSAQLALGSLIVGVMLLFVASCVACDDAYEDLIIELKEGPVTDSAFIRAAESRGETVLQFYEPIDRISKPMKKAVVGSEDARFFRHGGVDTGELTLAARDAMAGKGVRGASTITMQLAKNLYLSEERSIGRKLKEIQLALALEDALPKIRILEIYLNVAQFGPGVFGVEAAARKYFRCPARELTREQAAQLAAALPRPRSWHPGVEDPRYKKRIARVFKRTWGQDPPHEEVEGYSEP